MNNGDCSTCRRQKYCHHTCHEAKLRMQFVASHALHAKMLEMIARKKNPKSAEVTEEEAIRSEEASEQKAQRLQD